MVAVKAIFCIWTSIFMVLPGCLCQVLGPLGIHVPHHHHGGVGITVPSHEPCTLAPAGIPEPTVPCHCDERPDRTSDECVALVTPADGVPVQALCHELVVTVPPPHQTTLAFVGTSRGPPVRSPAMTRSFLCVYLV